MYPGVLSMADRGDGWDLEYTDAFGALKGRRKR